MDITGDCAGAGEPQIDGTVGGCAEGPGAGVDRDGLRKLLQGYAETPQFGPLVGLWAGKIPDTTRVVWATPSR